MLKKVVGILVIIIVLFGIYLVVKPKSQTPSMKTTASPTPVAKKLLLEIKKNKLTNSNNKFTFIQGDIIEITVNSDMDGEVHFHGYDRALDAKKGQAVKLEFTLDTAGNFPFELEDTSTELGTLIVNPK